MQAITTKILNQTNHQGMRVVAECQAMRIVIPWKYYCEVEENHKVARDVLVRKLGWIDHKGSWACGQLSNRNKADYCHVFIPRKG
jgi:hypothetical protein